MAPLEIKIPKVGESVKEAYIARWHAKQHDFVKEGTPVLFIETDKISVEIEAPGNGVLHIFHAEGETVAVETVVGKIESSVSGEGKSDPGKNGLEKETEKRSAARNPKEEETPQEHAKESSAPPAGPAVRALIEGKKVDPSKIMGSGPGGRITKGDILLYLEGKDIPSVKEDRNTEAETPIRKPISPIRQRISERLMESRQKTAMVTTFNEVDMTRVQEIRARHKESFQRKHGTSLGLLSFFVKASVEALREFPLVNAFLEEKEIVYHPYYHIGVAIGSSRGLVVPVIRHADRLTFAAIETAIETFVSKTEENKLALKDLEGATFTLSNGGVFGSLLSTPLLNTPQTAILGMHKIQDRPIALNGQVVIRPMMYLALSYDHRMIDGREGVNFLNRIKACIENPERIMIGV